MILYTAGPYSESCGVGTVEENIDRAREAAVRLWDMGYTVICPHLNTANFENLTTLSNKDFVDRDLEIVGVCDGIVMLPYWQSSRGAIREHQEAVALELPVYFWPDVPDMLAEAQKSVSVKKGHRLRMKGTRASIVK